MAPTRRFSDDISGSSGAPKGNVSVQTPLETYLREINETALLTAQDEKDLAMLIGEALE